MHAFVRAAACLMVVATGCSQSADATGTEPTAPTAAEGPPVAEASAAVAPTPEPAKTAPAPEPSKAEPAAPTTNAATALCANREYWSLRRRYALSHCTDLMKDGCDETLGVVIASVGRSLETSAERLQRAGTTMRELMAEMGSQTDSQVIKPAGVMLNEIKAYTPTDAEKEVHATLVADYEAFIGLSKRWSKSLHKYKGDVLGLADLQTETERAETKALAHEVRYMSLCNGTAK